MMRFRTLVSKKDIEIVRKITESTQFFYPHEVEIAVSIIEEVLQKGDEAGYQFLFIENDEKETIAYSCFGEIPCTKNRYDIYWIVVNNSDRGKGIGKLLMKETENRISSLGGEIIYLETSSQKKYISTCKFYENLAYFKEAEIKDFYSNYDNKIIYSKRL